MKQKTFLLRGKSSRTIIKEELEAFDRKINSFDSKHNIVASQIRLLVAFDHICLLETVWFKSVKKVFENETIPPSAVIEPGVEEIMIYNNSDDNEPKISGSDLEEVGALWIWPDKSLRGDFNKKRIDIPKGWLDKQKKTKEGYSAVLNKINVIIKKNVDKVGKQPDYRIYEVK